VVTGYDTECHCMAWVATPGTRQELGMSPKVTEDEEFAAVSNRFWG
jgi:hypothetical protein